MKDFNKLVLIFCGGFMVIFELFCRIEIGNLGFGMLVNYRWKLWCICLEIYEIILVLVNWGVREFFDVSLENFNSC